MSYVRFCIAATSMPVKLAPSSGWLVDSYLEVPRQQLIDPALLMTVDDGRQRGGQIGLRIDGIELAGFDE